jgi:hypothetical protein
VKVGESVKILLDQMLAYPQTAAEIAEPLSALGVRKDEEFRNRVEFGLL